MTRIAIAISASVVGLLALAPAQAQTPSVPDNYMESFGLNRPGQRLERRDTLRAIQDTTTATTQADMFNPPNSGGPAEPTTCGTTTYGHTVWYDFYPDVPGTVRLRASGYDTVLRVVPFNARKDPPPPDLDHSVCINDQGPNSTEELLIPRVRKGGAYTVQIGGVGNASGTLDFQFDFLADSDGDGTLDDVDDCRTLAGTRKNGCPPRVRANATLRALPVEGGLRILSLSVSAPKKSRVAVTCGRGCPSEVRRGGGKVKLRKIRGRELPAGSSVVIRVTKKKSIGAYIRFPVLDGNLGDRVERVLCPGSKKPRTRCR
ncbi:MAG TPA: hypothetical protein VGF25_21135 [Thermoleophilaceae bacterium]